MNWIDEPGQIIQFVFYMNKPRKKAINHVKCQSSLLRHLENFLFFSSLAFMYIYNTLAKVCTSSLRHLKNSLSFSSFAFIYIYNTLGKVIAPNPGGIYVFESEIRKGSSGEVFLVKPESLIVFKQLNATR